MKPYSAQDLYTLIQQFEDRSLPKSAWTHEAHLVVAIWYSKQYDFEQALELVRKNITGYNEAVGTPNSATEGYHESITRFWLLVAKAYIKNHHLLDIAELCREFIRSDVGQRSYPLKFYSKECLFSVEARQAWVSPDIQPLGF